MPLAGTGTTALLAAAVFFTCAQALLLRPLPILDPLGLLGNTEVTPNKRSVYIHSIKNNFYPEDDEYDAKPGYPKPSYTKPNYLKPIYKKPGDLNHHYPKPDYQKPVNLKHDDPKPSYPNPSTPKPACTTPKAKNEKPSPERSIIANIRGLIRDILYQEKRVKAEQYAPPPQSTEPTPYKPKTNHYNRLHAHYPVKDGPHRRPYVQGRKNEIYEHENHRPVAYHKQTNHQRANRDSDPQVTEPSVVVDSTPDAQTATPAAAVKAEPLIMNDVISNLRAYLDIFTGNGVTPSAETEKALDKTVAEVFREVLTVLNGDQTEATTDTTTPTTTTAKVDEATPTLLEKALAELDASLTAARENLERLASEKSGPTTLPPEIPKSGPESPTGDIGSNFPVISKSMDELLKELDELIPKTTEKPVSADVKADHTAVDDTDAKAIEILDTLNGIHIVNPVAREINRQTRHNYAEDQNEFPKYDEGGDSEEEYFVPPRANYAIAPRRPQTVQRYERPKSCPGHIEPSRPKPQYQQQRPRPQEHYLEPEQYNPVQNQYRQNVYRRPAPVPYPIEEEEEEEEGYEEEEDDGYNQEPYDYPENEEQCYEGNPDGY